MTIMQTDKVSTTTTKIRNEVLLLVHYIVIEWPCGTVTLVDHDSGIGTLGRLELLNYGKYVIYGWIIGLKEQLNLLNY